MQCSPAEPSTLLVTKGDIEHLAAIDDRSTPEMIKRMATDLVGYMQIEAKRGTLFGWDYHLQPRKLSTNTKGVEISEPEGKVPEWPRHKAEKLREEFAQYLPEDRLKLRCADGECSIYFDMRTRPT